MSKSVRGKSTLASSLRNRSPGLNRFKSKKQTFLQFDFDKEMEVRLTKHKNLRELVNGEFFGALAPSLAFRTRLLLQSNKMEQDLIMHKSIQC